MYLWLLEMRRPQSRHEREIKADRPGNNNLIQCTQPTALRFRKCRASSCEFVLVHVHVHEHMRGYFGVHIHECDQSLVYSHL